jgi:hypothetical protein
VRHLVETEQRHAGFLAYLDPVAAKRGLNTGVTEARHPLRTMAATQ